MEEVITQCVDCLCDADPKVREEALRRIKELSAEVGPDDTRRILLPLFSRAIDDGDQLLVIFAQELGDFLHLVGGAAHADVLLELLEPLAAVDETLLHKCAVESICKVARAVGASQSIEDSHPFYMDEFFPLVRRRAAGAGFESRLSACTLLPVFLSGLPASEQQLRSDAAVMFEVLSRDLAWMVRASTAANIADVAAALARSKPEMVAGLFPVFFNLAKDFHDRVRVAAVANAAAFLRVVSDVDETGLEPSMMLDFVCSLVSDKSTQVRQTFAEQLCPICDIVPHATVRRSLLSAYIELLDDREPEVRLAATLKLTDFVKRIILLPQDSSVSAGDVPVNVQQVDGLNMVVSDILPPILELANDLSPSVRRALASSIMDIASLVGPDMTMQYLPESVLALLEDQEWQVRFNVIAHLNNASHMLSIEKINAQLLPTIAALAKSGDQSLRVAVIEAVPPLALHLVKDVETSSSFAALCTEWLDDRTDTVIQASIANLKKTTQIVGVEWAEESVIPRLLQNFSTSNTYFKLRAASLDALGMLSAMVGQRILEVSVLPVVTEIAAVDKVYKVRLFVARVLKEMAKHVGHDARENVIRPCLMKLTKPSEAAAEIHDCAIEALASLDSHSS